MAPQRTNTITVRRPQELNLFCKMPKRIMVRLSLSELSSSENIYWEQCLNKWRNECGCQMGTIGLFLGLVTCFSSFDISVLSTVKDALVAFLVTITITLTFAVVGKLLGLGIARARLKYSIRMLTSIALK